MVMWAVNANKTVQNFLNSHADFHNYLEIGSHTGESLKIIADMFPNKKVYGIDPFVSDGTHLGIPKGIVFEEERAECHEKLAGVSNATVFEMTSKEFLSKYKNDLEKFDISVIFIDGSHIFEDILIDIDIASRCIERNGGLILFDDIDMQSVKDAMTVLRNKYSGRILLADNNGGAMTFAIKGEKKMKHLILGSSGLIGSYLTEYIRDYTSDDVIEYDLQTTPQEDLRLDSINLYDKMKECDFVHFLAFDIGGSEYMKKYQYSYDFISNNIKIMDRVFDMLRVTNKPFLFAGSQMSNMSHTTYGVLKHLGEYYTQALDGILAKFWNVYGVEPDGLKSHVIADFLKSAKNTGKIKMRTDGNEIRQFLYAQDCAKCLYTLAAKEDSIDRRNQLHITSFEWVSIYDLAQLIAKDIYPGTEIIAGADTDALQGGYKNEPDNYILNFWKPETPLVEGLKKVDAQMLLRK